jgi:FAD/FMN-containing dehydrogenase
MMQEDAFAMVTQSHESRLTISPAHIAALRGMLGPKGFSDDAQRIAAKCQDWRGRYQGHTGLLALPGDVEGVSRLVAYCASHQIAILPQGGNTGLVGGSTPQGEVLVSLERMNRVRGIDPLNATLSVDAGVILQTVQETAAAADALFPLSLGSQGSATIGGLISTNAGGVAVLRYGMMRDLVLGLEVVLPDGRVLNTMRGLRKDNTGLDLKQLFIGAEGTLGVITGAVLKLFPRPGAISTAFLALDRIADAPALLRLCQHRSGGSVTAFEIMPHRGLELVLQHIPQSRAPLETASPWYVLVEISTLNEELADTLLAAMLESAFENGLIRDGVVAHNQQQSAALWGLRENLPEAERAYGKAVKHDVSVPISSVADFIRQADQIVREHFSEAEIIAFGHVGDGNIHYNVSAAPDQQTVLWQRAEAITESVYDCALALGGSISAEHGIGILKKDDLANRYPLEAEMMGIIRRALDPGRIMNPRMMVD